MEQQRSPHGPRQAPDAARSGPTPLTGGTRPAPDDPPVRLVPVDPSTPGDSESQPSTEPRDKAPSGPGTEHVVLAVGSPYFHDGRVGRDRYASDLTSSFIGSVTAAQLLLRGLFDEVGAPPDAFIEATCDRLRLRFGSDVGEAQFTEEDKASTGDGRVDPSPVEHGHADEWVRGLVAVRDADHAQALAAFESEAAEAAASGSPQRAAIAYRAASSAATAAGRSDHANRLLRLAGKAYLEIAEKPETIPQGVFMAYREGARCFLEAGNLPLAHKCLSKAIAIGETLGYTESG